MKLSSLSIVIDTSMHISSKEVLLDTIRSAAVIVGQGSLIKSKDFKLIEDVQKYKTERIQNKEFSALNPLRKISLESYAYLCECVNKI